MVKKDMDLCDEVRKTILLNKQEALLLTKEYFVLYIISLFKDYKGKGSRRVLIEKLKEYYDTIREENSYLRFLLDNVDSIENEESLNKVLDNLDIVNEQTYIYYDNILKDYEDNMFYGTLDKKIVSPKHFGTVLENSSYMEEILGLVLNVHDLEEYYKHSADAFKYLLGHTKIYDSPANEGMDFYGCYPIEDKDTGILTEIRLCVPKISDLETMLINVHEFKHGLDLYPYIGAVLPEMDYEASAKNEEEVFKKKYLLREKICK